MSKKLDRREFLRKGLAFSGVLIASSQLPSFAADSSTAAENEGDSSLKTFKGRGRTERMSIAYTTVELGLKEPFSVLHISDTHLCSAGDKDSELLRNFAKKRTKTFGGLMEDALVDSLEWAKKHTDYVVHTGDLIDWQSEENFDLVKKYMGEKVISAMGNHEFSLGWGTGFPKVVAGEEHKKSVSAKLEEAYGYDLSFHSQIVNGVNFIAMDDVYGYVTQEQVDRFKEEAAKKLPIVLCLHVPIMTPNIWRAVGRYWNKNGSLPTTADVPAISGDFKKQTEDPVTSEFIKYLKKEKLLKVILSGHEHFSMEDRFSKTCMQYLTSGNYLFSAREILFV